MMHRIRHAARRGTALAAGLAALTVVALPGPARACGQEPYMAMICMTAATFCPRGYIEASGQLLPISQYQALFSLIGTKYGGDGRTTFAVPDLRSRVPVGLGNGSGLSPVVQGERRGAESRTLTVLEMPQHNHGARATFTPEGVQTTVQASQTDAGAAAPSAGSHLAAASGRAQVYLDGDPGSTVELGGVSSTGGGGNVDVTVDNTGGNRSFSVVDPGLGIRFCMAAQGVFPPRD